MGLLEADAPDEERQDAGGDQGKQQLRQAELGRGIGEDDVACGGETHTSGIRLATHMGDADERPLCELAPQFVERFGVRDILRKRSEEHTSELQSLMRISYAVFCLKKKNQNHRI